MPNKNRSIETLSPNARRPLRWSCIITIVVVSFSLTGCQTLGPFGQSMRTRVAAAREWTGNGFDAVRRGAASEARGYFSKASKHLPKDHGLVVNVARTHFQEGNYEQAIKELKRASKLNGSDSAISIELGQYLLADGQIDAASEQVHAVLKKNHRSASAWLLSGKIHAARGHAQLALSDFQKAIGIDPDREEIQLEIVRGYRQLNDPLRALSAVENILERYPSHQQPAAAVIEKSRALVQLRRTNSAIETLNQAIANGDTSPEVRLALSNLNPTANPSLQIANPPASVIGSLKIDHQVAAKPDTSIADRLR